MKQAIVMGVLPGLSSPRPRTIAVIHFDCHRTMDADAQVAPIAALVADATRATILWSLSDGRALPACDLALEAGVTAATISYQLEKLITGGLVAAERQGRHRYYRLAGPTVVSLLEVLAAVAPPAPARSFREGQKGKALRFARTCYDH